MVMAAHVVSLPLFCGRVQFSDWSLLQSNIIACSVFGAYTIISPIDHYIGSNLKYIVINNVRRATNPDFKSAIVDPPFQTRGFILIQTKKIVFDLDFYFFRSDSEHCLGGVGAIGDVCAVLFAQEQTSVSSAAVLGAARPEGQTGIRAAHNCTTGPHVRFRLHG